MKMPAFSRRNREKIYVISKRRVVLGEFYRGKTKPNLQL